MTSDSYIRLYEGALGRQFCDSLISQYESTLTTEADKVKSLSLCFRPDGTKLCGACNCTRMNTMEHDGFKEYNATLLATFQGCLIQYLKDCRVTKEMFPDPKTWGWEEFKVKRYRVGEGGPNDEQFKDHVDVQSHAGAKRYLIMMAYLNEDFDEGETQFPHHGISIPPKTGSILIFPPLWTHLHRGRPPINGTAKYITMTYLNYTDMTKVDYNKNPLLGESYREGHGSMAAKENED
jgi:hypothetical protein